MASSGELRIGRGWLSAAATVVIAVVTIAAARGEQSSTRIGNLERQGSVLEQQVKGLKERLDYMTEILEKLRDRADQ